MADVIPVAQLHRRARMLVERLRARIAAAGLGVTVQGTHVTVRLLDSQGRLASVTMVVTDVQDAQPADAFDAEVDK